MDDTPVTPRAPMQVGVQLLEPVASLLARNNVPSFVATVDDPETGDSGRFLPVARANADAVDDPSSITLTYAAPDCPLTLPAGRQMQISFEGPVVDSAYLIYPMEPMDWDEMQLMVAQTTDIFARAGWTVKPQPRFGPLTKILHSITSAQLNKKTYGTKTVRTGVWHPCDTPFVEAIAEVRHLNSAPSGVSIPPAGASAPQNHDAADRFVMRVSFNIDQDTLSQEIKTLRDARRFEVKGTIEVPIAMRHWVETPDWRPENWQGRWIK